MMMSVLVASMLLAGMRWPGALVAGAIFTYQASILSGIATMTEAYMVAALAIGLFKARDVLPGLKLNPLDLAFGLFVVFHCLTAAYSPSPAHALAGVQRLFMAATSLFLLGRLCASVAQPHKLATQVATALLVFGSIFAGLFLFNDSASQAVRLQIGGASAVGVAQPFPLALAACTFAMVATLSRGKIMPFLVCAVAAAVLLYASVLSGTRGVPIALAAALLVMALLAGTRSNIWLAVLAVIALAVLTVPFLSGLGEERLFRSGLERLLVNFRAHGIATDVSLTVRLEQQAMALRLWQENPLLGVGLGGYAALTGRNYPHNILIEIATESGALGLILFVTFTAMLAHRLLQQPDAAARILFCGLFAAGFMHMQISFALFMAKPLFLLAGIAASWPAHSLSRRARAPALP